MGRKCVYWNGVFDTGPEPTARRGIGGISAMAGQARSRGTRTSGRPDRAARPSSAVATAPGREAVYPRPTRKPARSASAPDPLLHTRSTYRLLVMRGLAPGEAANLTAYLSGTGLEALRSQPAAVPPGTPARRPVRQEGRDRPSPLSRSHRGYTRSSRRSPSSRRDDHLLSKRRLSSSRRRFGIPGAPFTLSGSSHRRM